MSSQAHAVWPEGVKFVLFLYCYTLKDKSSQVEVLWEDHRNDLFINSFGQYRFRLVRYY
jgi:hypothetical protein